MPHRPGHVISRRARARLIGSPEQRIRSFQRRQEETVAALPAADQATLRASGFATRPQVVRPNTTLSRHFGVTPETASGFAIRGREGFRTTRTGFISSRPGLSGLNRLLGAQGKELARHEVAHQTLVPRGLTVPQEHRIIAAGSPPPPPRPLRRSQASSAFRGPTTSFPSPRPIQTQGFQTPHLTQAARTGTSAQQGQAREQMRRLGRRLRGRIDF